MAELPSSRDWEQWLYDVNTDLRAVGRLPRMISAGLFALALAIACYGWTRGWTVIEYACILTFPSLLFLSSLRIRARATSNALVVRSYIRTYLIRFSDVDYFIDVPYDGAWFLTGAGGDGWRSLWLRVINVTMKSGRGLSWGLGSTMCGTRRCAHIVNLLNVRVDAVALEP